MNYVKSNGGKYLKSKWATNIRKVFLMKIIQYPFNNQMQSTNLNLTTNMSTCLKNFNESFYHLV